DPEALQHRLDAWTDELDPRTDLERYFVRSAVEASWRLDRVRHVEAAAAARRVAAAGAEADRKDALEVEHSLKFLGLWPEKYLRRLRGSARGCRALLDRWRDLVAALEHACCWLESERRWAFALAGLEPHRWHEDAATRRLVTLDLATQVDGCTPYEARTFGFAHLKPDEAAMHVTPEEFEVRVEALLAGLPAPAAARAELLAWARASIVELEAHLDEVEVSERRDRELAVEEALFDGGPSGAARLRAELAQYRVLRTSLQEVRRLQRERGEAGAAGATDRAAGSGDPAAPTEADLEAEVLSMMAEATATTEAKFESEVLSVTADATATTEAKAEAVGPVTKVDIAAPAEANPSPDASHAPSTQPGPDACTAWRRHEPGRLWRTASRRDVPPPRPACAPQHSPVMTLARGPHGRYTLRNLASVRGLSPVMEPGSSPQPRRSFGASLCHACFVAVPGARPERDRSPLRPG
ncbi:MAG: hypothetical protein JO252_16360, partial [Planctomycetaceae bacterium]|nr:hypothetical protein [Planctomycetaceae bacterium]